MLEENMNIKTDNFPKAVLRRGKELPIKKFHPWIFTSAINFIDGEPEEGDIVEVYSCFEEFLGLGHYLEGSVAIKLFAFEPYVPDEEFWKERLQRAYNLREQMGLTHNPETSAYRLVHSEADMLPGLTIDFYNGTAIFQTISMGMYNLRYVFAKALKEIYGDRLLAVYDKSAETLYKSTGVPCRDSFLLGEDGQDTIRESGHFFRVDWKFGNNTGFFLDHREGRELVKRYAKDKKVLDLFCYTGAYSVHALKGGAKMVHSVDTSQMAIDLLKDNMSLNGLQETNHEAFVTDSKKFMTAMPEEIYDMIILDPPTLAKTAAMESTAIKGYKKLNTLAMSKIKKDGVIVTYCSSKIFGVEQFRSILYSASLEAGRKITILRQIHQAEDHPVCLSVPELEYLKGFVIKVD